MDFEKSDRSMTARSGGGGGGGGEVEKGKEYVINSFVVTDFGLCL
jgi:hypothetical protein